MKTRKKLAQPSQLFRIAVILSLTIIVSGSSSVYPTAVPVTGQAAPAPQAQQIPNPIMQGGWKGYWQITKDDGLAVQNVTFNGKEVLSDGRLPGIYVTYLHNVCIFYDEIGYAPQDETNASRTQNATLTPSHVKISTQGNGNFTLIAFATVPNYAYTQSWQFYSDGRFMPLLTIANGGCIDIHTYEPRWRLAFPDGTQGTGGHTVYDYRGQGWSPVRIESEKDDSGLRDSTNNFTNWMITDLHQSYYFVPYDSPESPATPHKILVLHSNSSEIETSHFPGAVTPYKYRNGQAVYDANITLWYFSTHSEVPHNGRLYNVTTGLMFYPQGY